jgi:hypothetical protein
VEFDTVAFARTMEDGDVKNRKSEIPNKWPSYSSFKLSISRALYSTTTVIRLKMKMLNGNSALYNP